MIRRMKMEGRMLSNFRKLDMHTHSEYSPDSKLSLDKIGVFLERNPDFGIILSDHNVLEGALELQKSFPDRVIAGEEIKTDSGEVTGLFLSERIPPKRKLNWTMDAIIAQGGLVYVPHPCDRLRTSRLRPGVLGDVLKRADIVEIFNSRNVFGKDDAKAQTLAGEYALAKGCGSDAHTYWELANSYVEFAQAFELTPDGLLSALEGAAYHTKRTFRGIHVVTKAQKIKKKYFRPEKGNS